MTSDDRKKILQLRAEALGAKDQGWVDICNAALSGDAWCRLACLEAIVLRGHRPISALEALRNSKT